MTKWEYKQVQLDIQKLSEAEAKLNELGADGWELVGVVSREHHGYSHEVFYYFKRPSA